MENESYQCLSGSNLRACILARAFRFLLLYVSNRCPTGSPFLYQGMDYPCRNAGYLRRAYGRGSDSLALVVLTIPIIFPIVLRLGFDSIWFGVIIVLVNEMGVITPPVGVNVFVMKGIAPDVPVETIFKGIFPFLGALIVCTIVIMAFPQIATFLPSFVTY